LSCPNRNRIERFWNVVKHQLLYSRYYERFDELCGTPMDGLEERKDFGRLLCGE
jgi:hypothetical protein